MADWLTLFFSFFLCDFKLDSRFSTSCWDAYINCNCLNLSLGTQFIGMIHPHKCVRTHACMHVAMRVHVHPKLHTYICIYVCTYVCIHACMYVCMCTYVRTYVCTYVHMYAHIYACMYIWIIGVKVQTIVVSFLNHSYLLLTRDALLVSLMKSLYVCNNAK